MDLGSISDCQSETDRLSKITCQWILMKFSEVKLLLAILYFFGVINQIVIRILHLD